jgi:MYXO-CTERM domain-containing protein
LTALAALALPAVAHANGRFPASNQILVSPSDPNSLVLRTTFGILFSSDTGKNWDIVCEKAVGYGGTEDPSLGLTGTTILAGTFEGLTQSADKACSWALVPGDLTQNVIVDVVVRPDTPSTVLALSNKFLSADDAGASLFTSNVFVTTNAGQSWAKNGPALDPTIVFETIEVAKSDPQRVYVSGVRGAGSTEQGVVLTSKDAGQTWTEHAFPLDTSSERAPFISAVDPTNADRVYARTKGTAGSRLLVSDDAGGSWKEVVKFQSDMLGFALSPDGKKIYVGGPKDGLQVGDSTSLAFAQVSKIAIQCLGAFNGKLYACSNEVGGFILGTSDDDGKSFTALLHLCGVRGPLACGPQTSEAQCVPDWPALRDTLSTCPDGGTSSSGGSSGTPDGGTSSGSSSGCSSCALGPEDAGVGSLAALGVVGIGLLASRRRRRR